MLFDFFSFGLLDPTYLYHFKLVTVGYSFTFRHQEFTRIEQNIVLLLKVKHQILGSFHFVFFKIW